MQKVEPNKEFVLYFDKGINLALSKESSIYVLDEQNKKIAVTVLKQDDYFMKVLPPKNGYASGQTFHLYIDRDLDVEHVNDKNLPDEYHVPFEVIKST